MGVKQRIKELISYLGISQKEFEKKIGASNGYVNSISKSIGGEYLRNIMREFSNVNEDWLLYGEGNMLKNEDFVMDDFNTRLNDVIRHLGLTQKKLADEIGTSQSAISAIANGTRPMTEGFACRMERAYGVNAYWLLTGNGEMLKGNGVLMGDAQKEIVEQISQIEFISHKATASFVEDYDSDNREKEYVGVVPLPGEILDDSYKVFEVIGESMLPQIKPFARILVQKIPETKWHYAEGVVVIVLKDMVLIKRITQNALDTDNWIELSSDNSKYGKKIIQLCDIRAIFKAVRKVSEPID